MTETEAAIEAGVAARERPGDPCVLVIFGAAGDLTKRLLIPAIYNLARQNLEMAKTLQGDLLDMLA